MSLGSCTAHAGIGIVEYYEKRAFNKHIDGSRLFLFKTTRNLMQVTGDKGYGWMPYDYILNNLALDFWSLPGMNWVDSKIDPFKVFIP